MAKQKFYVVWKGRRPGIFESWEDCTTQIHGFPGAVYKSFNSKQLAEQAFDSASNNHIGKKVFKSNLTTDALQSTGSPVWDSISVDGAWNTATGVVEYQGVDTASGSVLFQAGPFQNGTNNIVEFLAIVHALAYCKKQRLSLPVYSDSHTAITWVGTKNAKTKHPRTEKNGPLFLLVDRALKWLQENEYPNPVLKWKTEAWGENPADFGRK